jgi:hypothetical protein
MPAREGDDRLRNLSGCSGSSAWPAPSALVLAAVEWVGERRGLRIPAAAPASAPKVRKARKRTTPRKAERSKIKPSRAKADKAKRKAILKTAKTRRRSG